MAYRVSGKFTKMQIAGLALSKSRSEAKYLGIMSVLLKYLGVRKTPHVEHRIQVAPTKDPPVADKIYHSTPMEEEEPFSLLKFSYPAIGMLEALCPHCETPLPKFPGRKKKCPSCSRHMYLEHTSWGSKEGSQ